MQNNPFNNFLAQLQGAATSMPVSQGQDNSGQSTANMMGNANLLGAMQNALARGSTGNVIGSLPGAVPSVSAPPDMSVFRQFQLQQNQPSPVASRPTLGSGTTALMTASPTAAGNVQALSSAWNSPANPGAVLNTMQNPMQNTMQVPSTAWNNPAAPAAGASGNPGQGMNNNPLMNAMLQTYMSQQMAMQQQAQSNPMAGLMQQMMQSMMPFNAMMPGAAAAAPQMPALDPNMAKQLVVQLMGQLQQSGQLAGDDSIKQLMQQPAAGGSNEAAGKAIPTTVQIDDDLDVKEEEEPVEQTAPVVMKKTPHSVKGKGKAQEAEIIKAAETVSQLKGPAKKSRTTKKSAPAASMETPGRAGGADSISPASSVKTEEAEIPSSRRKGPASKTGKKNVPEVVAIDSDSDDNNGGSFQAVETASEDGSSILEEKKKTKKGKGGKGRGKAAEKATKKPGKDLSMEPAVGIQRTKKAVPRTIPEPVRRIKIEDTAEDPAWITEQSTSSPRAAKGFRAGPSAADLPIQVKVEESADVKPFIIPPGVKLRRCEVRLQRLVLKRDARGRFIIPEHLKRASDTVMYKTEPSEAGRNVTPHKMDLVPAGGRRGSPGAARDVSMTETYGIELLANLNAATQPQMRTLYVGHMKGNMQWLNLIGWAKSRCFCQCAFCPILSETPKAILTHIRGEHPDLTFALTKMKQPSGRFLYIFCRHCDFIALDVTINWLHFEVYHNVSDILEGTARPRIDDFAPAKLEIQRGLEDIMESQQSYMCYDCELITDESKQLAIHVLQQHADTVHYNGCFVKLLGIRRPLKSENVAYKRIVSDEEFAEFRQEAFICMMCEYIAHCPYMALSHNLNTHQTKRILFSCMERGCTFNCVTETQMIQHLSGRHKLKADLTCSSTLLEPSRGSFVECVIGVNRKTSSEPSLQKCNAPVVPAAAANPGRISPVTFTTDEDTEEEGGAVNGEDKKEKKTKDKIKVEGSEKNSLQCTAVSSSLQKSGVENGESVADEDDDEADDKLPDDIQITINPPSPDGDAKSPKSDVSGDTIVEEEDGEEEAATNGDQVSPEQDEEPMEEEGASVEDDSAASKADDQMESEGPSSPPPVLEAVKDLAAAGDQPVKDAVEDQTTKDEGAGDFAADIPPEPYCLSADARLQVPSEDVEEDADTGGASRGAADEQSRQLDTPEKSAP